MKYGCIIPNLLVSWVADAIGEVSATKIFIANLMTQPGETDGYDVHRHLAAVAKYAPQIHFDYVIVNNRPISQSQVEKYRADGADQIGLDDEIGFDVLAPRTEFVRTDLLQQGEMVRHDPERLSRVVIDCVAKARLKMPASLES